MKKAIVSGSFDPITIGHLDIIKKAADLFDEVHIVIFINPEKKYMFSVKERLDLIKESCKEINNIIVAFYSGYVVNYASEHKINYIVRGIRNEDDYIYESKMARLNKQLDSNIETIFFNAETDHTEISSTLFRSMIADKKVNENAYKICPWLRK